jgi:hypothetical protein
MHRGTVTVSRTYLLHALCTGAHRNAYSVVVEKPEDKKQPARYSCRGTIILKWILKKYYGKSWTELIWLRIGEKW